MPAPGVLHVIFNEERDTAPERLEPVITEIERLSEHREVGLVGQFDPKVRAVDVRVVPQWISLVTRPGIRLVAACVVTDSPLIRLAAQTISLGTRLRGARFETAGFAELAEAMSWVLQQVH
jgi:hypothetical protein